MDSLAEQLGHTAVILGYHWPGLGWEEPWFLKGQSSKDGFSRKRRGTHRKGNTNLLLGSSNLPLAAVHGCLAGQTGQWRRFAEPHLSRGSQEVLGPTAAMELV